MDTENDVCSVAVPLQVVREQAHVPRYAYDGDAATDLCSTIDCTLQPFERALIPCGISLAIPQGYGGFVLPRSGLAAKHGITVLNAPGLIDSNYRGEVAVSLINLDPQTPFEIHVGDRIAQLSILPTPPIRYVVVDSLDDTDRGQGGFGSSGVSTQSSVA